jgi:hypothetical protein
VSRSTLRPVIIVLTLATAFVHGVILNVPNVPLGRLDPPFTLNAVGYLALMAALFFVQVPGLEGREALLHYVYMAFAGVTIVLYFVIVGADSFSNVLGLVTKTIEVLLITALWLHLRAPKESGGERR